MFGTLRLNPHSNTVDFVERADGKSFSSSGNVIPPHSACTHCRSKKIRCGGQKPVCFRCKASSLECVYAAVEGSAERRRGPSGSKRNQGGEGNPSTIFFPEAETDQIMSEPGAMPRGRTSTSRSRSTTVSISTPATTRTQITAASSVSDGRTTSASPHGTHDFTSCLDPDLLCAALKPHSSSHSTEFDFEYFAPEVVASHGDECMEPEYGDATMSHDASYSDFNVDLTTLWSPSSVDVLSFPSVGALSSSPCSSSFAQISNTELSASMPVQYGNDTLPEPRHSGNNSDNRCGRQCLHIITRSIEEVETRMHSMSPRRLEGVLSWQKQACQKGAQVLQCHTCYASSEHMMLLIMFCDKLIMLTQKLLWHTLDETVFHGTASMGDYEIRDPSEMIAIIRVLSGNCVNMIAKLLAGVKMSPAVQGKQVQLMMIRNIEQQVAKASTGIKESLELFLK